MNRHYIFIMSDTLKQSIHCDYCKDILKAVKLFSDMPTVLLHGEKQNVLVHLEIADNEQDAKQRFDEIFKMNLTGKIKVIEQQNPNWIMLEPNVNIEI